MKSEVRIVSDGTRAGTIVTIDGKRLDNVRSVGWYIDSKTGKPYARLELTDVQLDVNMPGAEVEEHKTIELSVNGGPSTRVPVYNIRQEFRDAQSAMVRCPACFEEITEAEACGLESHKCNAKR